MPTIIKGEGGGAKEQKNENLGMIVRENEKGGAFSVAVSPWPGKIMTDRDKHRRCK